MFELNIAVMLKQNQINLFLIGGKTRISCQEPMALIILFCLFVITNMFFYYRPFLSSIYLSAFFNI